MNLTAAMVPGRKHGRPCTICINMDREGIDKWLVEGRSYADLHRTYPDISVATFARHHRNGHIQAAISRRVEHHSDLTMDSVLARVRKSIDRAEDRITKGREIIDTATGSKLEAQGIADQYYAQAERVLIEGCKLLTSVIVDSTKLKLEQDKLQAAKQGQGQDTRARMADYMRKYHSIECELCHESLERYLEEVGT